MRGCKRYPKQKNGSPCGIYVCYIPNKYIHCKTTFVLIKYQLINVTTVLINA